MAANLAAEGRHVTLVSKDLPLRLKASVVGLEAEEYRAESIHPSEAGRTGMVEMEVEDLAELYRDGTLALDAARDLPCHAGLVLVSARSTALGRVGPDKQVHLVRGDRDAFGLVGRSAKQRIALELLSEPEIGIVSLGGRAGTGKSALALCAGLEAVLERGQHRKVVVFRPLFAVGGQELGYLPGSESEKMAPWAQAVFDTLGAVLSRIGQNSKVVLTHDVAQRDNLRVAGGASRRGGRRGREAQGAPVVRARHSHPLGAVADRGLGHRPAGGRAGLSRSGLSRRCA